MRSRRVFVDVDAEAIKKGRIKRSALAGVVVALAIVAAARPAAAQQVIYSTFGPGDSFNQNGGAQVSGPDNITHEAVAQGNSFFPTTKAPGTLKPSVATLWTASWFVRSRDPG